MSVDVGSDEWLDAGQVAAILRISRKTVWNYAALGRLPVDGKFGRSPAWKRSTVERYAETMHPNGKVARQNRAARQARRVHGEIALGSEALCGTCGAVVVFAAADGAEKGSAADTGPQTGADTTTAPQHEPRGRWVGEDGQPHRH